MAVSVLSALRALSAARPVVLAIDDVQWLDADSARALTFALRRLRDEPVLVLVARRGDRPAALPLGLDAWEDARVVRVRLDPLGPTADQLYAKYGSWQQVIDASMRTSYAVDRELSLEYRPCPV